MKYLLPASLVAAGALGSGCVVSVDSQAEIARETRRFAVRGVPEVSLTTFDGSVELQGGDGKGVVVGIEKRGPTREAVDALVVTATQDGARVVVEVRKPAREPFDGIGFHRSASARLVVTVPRKANVVARTGDGSIRIDGVSGRIELRTGDGSIRAADVAGDLRLHTGDGSVNVRRAEGTLDLDTGDGGVTVSGRLSAVRMRTGDGSIEYRAEPGTVMSDLWDISTGDGGISLYLPAKFNADIDAHTGDGRITNDLELSPVDDGREDRRTLRARIGTGGRTLRIRTGDGSIRLRSSGSMEVE